MPVIPVFSSSPEAARRFRPGPVQKYLEKHKKVVDLLELLYYYG